MSGSSVTIPGVSGSSLSLSFVGSANLGLATQIANALAAAASANTLDVVSYSGGPLPAIPSGDTTLELVLSSSISGQITVPAAPSGVAEFLVVNNTQALTIHGSPALQLIGGGPGSLTIDDPAIVDIGASVGSTGTVVMTFSTADSPYQVAMGQGFETVNSQGSGTITGGTGPDVINVSTTGSNNVIEAGSDGTTINAAGFASSIDGSNGALTVNDSGYLDSITGGVLDSAAVTTSGYRADVTGGSGPASGLTDLDTGLRNTIQAGGGATSVTLDGSFGRTRGGTGSFNVLDQTANNTIIGGTTGLTAVTIAAAATGTDLYGRAGNMAVLDLGADALIGSGQGTAVMSINGAGTQVYGGSGNLDVIIGAASVIAAGLGANTTVDASSASATGALVFGGFDSVAASDGTLSVLGGADSLIAATGGSNATIDAGSGFTGVYIGTGASVNPIAGNVVVDGGSGALQVNFIGGVGSATVFGGEGAATLFGVDGTNAMFVGSTAASAPGGFLFANGSNAGSETLNAGSSTTNDTLFAAHGNDSLVAGSGTDFIDVGLNTGSLGSAQTVTGGTTVVGGAGHDLMVFTQAAFAGGAVITNFTSNDSVLLVNYNGLAGGNQASIALADATTVPGSGGTTDTTLTLADGTHITFVDATVQQLTGHISSS